VPLRPSRRVGVLLLTAALLALWQALRLPLWTFQGPGPGLFPQALAALCVLLSLLEIIAPSPIPSPSPWEAAAIEPERSENRTFRAYATGIIIITAGAFYAGFAVTTFALMLVVLRFGEGVGWLRTILTSAGYVLLGWLAFGVLLRVNLPEGPLDRAFLALVH
jgi:Tripartite tricarboxylate transporter TctB family